MAKGTEEKNIVINKILETFNGSFLYNGGKELRIPVGEVQIKVTLTCAKENVAPGEDVALPGATPKETVKEGPAPTFEEPEVVVPSAAELNNVNNLLSALDLL